MRNLFIILVILLTSACGNQTIRQDKPQYTGLAQAERHFQEQNYNQAARAFEHLYMNYNQDIFALRAADSWMYIKQYENAQNLMAKIKQSDHPLYILVTTELLLSNQQYTDALNTLNRLPKNIGSEYKVIYLRIAAVVLSRNNQFLEAAMVLIELSTLDNSRTYEDVIINNLVQTPENELNQALFEIDTTELEQGWLEAAIVSYSQDQESILQWKNNWENHPAKAFFVQINQYNNIAVLLPMTGRYKDVSASIQEGMMAALYRDDSTDQTITFFDTGSNSENFSYAWYGAIESGVDFIIGPLLKNSIKQLTQLNSSTTPVMLLNQLEDGEENTHGFYQFALSQEDEVRNVANRLKAENKKRIMLLAPESETGRKLARSLESNILFNDGQVVSYEFYPESTHDYSQEIKKALGLNDSTVRTRQLQSIISNQLSSTAQIRPDIDAIVILARPKQARLIKPQLKFYQAENVPVYSTSQLLSSSINPTLDKDLNGINFCQSAFVIDPSSLQFALNFDVSKIKADKKFFAFGYDAIALTPRLEWLLAMQNQKIESMSGYLSIDSSGKIHRDLAWAQFQRGRPVLLPPLEPENFEEINQKINQIDIN
jgi:outer membrane PBP1 activator LpoA protein